MYFAIPTVSERTSEAQTLSIKLLSYYDPENVALVFDEKRHLIHNHNRAWRLCFEKTYDWGAVVQDDVILGNDFKNRLDVVLRTANEKGLSVVTLYSNRKDDRIALTLGKAWRVMKGSTFLNEQFLLMTHDTIAKYLKFFDENLPTIENMNHRWHDTLLAKFFVQNKLDVMVALPNLVDHRNEKSSIGYPTKIGGIERKSRTFEG